MSKVKNLNCESPSYGNGYVAGDRLLEIIVGNVLPVIEAAGLPQPQEEAIKSLIKEKIYNNGYDLMCLIDSRLYSRILEVNFKNRQEANIKGVPQSGVKLEEIK